MIDARQHIIGKYIPYTFETITVTDTAIGLTASSTYLLASPRPKRAFLTFETAQCRIRMDGTIPTSTVGHLYNPTQSLMLEGHSQLNNFKAIATGVTSAKIQVTYLR
jgi:hypothetical protein